MDKNIEILKNDNIEKLNKLLIGNKITEVREENSEDKRIVKFYLSNGMVLLIKTKKEDELFTAVEINEVFTGVEVSKKEEKRISINPLTNSKNVKNLYKIRISTFNKKSRKRDFIYYVGSTPEDLELSLIS